MLSRNYRKRALRANTEAKENGFTFGIPLGPGTYEAAPSATHILVDISDEDNGKPDPNARVVNEWYTTSRKERERLIQVIHDRQGRARIRCGPDISPTDHRLIMQIASMQQAENSILIPAERKAQKKLRTFLSQRQWTDYVLANTFIEVSSRSQVCYLLRRGRPTVAYSWQGKRTMILCALCLHPLAYYQGTFVGALCPTDDIIAHLLFIRGDEPGFWRKANQHSPDDILAGIY